jgi:tight adherence protein C
MIDLALSNWIFRLLILAVVFAFAAGSVIFVVNWTTARTRVARDLAKLGAVNRQVAPNSLARSEGEGTWARLANRLEKNGLKLSDKSDDKVRAQLNAAGFRSASAPRVYTLVRLVLVFALPGWYLLIASLSSEPPGITKLYIVCLVLGLLGLYLPNVFIRAKADRRRTEIINGFPDALDLMLVCVEAGLGLEAALDRVGREVARTHTLIAELLAQTTILMRAGSSREHALRRLSDSAGVDEIRSFSTLLIQSDRLGTSIASTLRVYASEMREARRLRAEERAHRLPVLISIPLVVCMLPTMIGVLALPAIVRVVRDVVPALGS